MAIYKLFISKALRYGPCITRDHTVLPAKRTRTIPAFTAQPQGATATHCAYPRRDARL